MPTALVTGAGGFIGGHLVKRLLEEGFSVKAVDIKPLANWWQMHEGCENISGDLREEKVASHACHNRDHVYQLAADMGGAGYVFSGDNDAEILQNNLRINLNIAKYARAYNVGKVLYTSSACVYPKTNQEDPNNPDCSEDSVYPADPDSEYGWEKLTSERLYLAFARNYALRVYIVRLHNVYGSHGSWNDGREKAPAAICRKVAEAKLTPEPTINVWGDGKQVRSFMWISDCVEGIRRIMDSDIGCPINLGSSESITINGLIDIVANIAGINLNLFRQYDTSKPQGVRGRNSDNTLILKELGWEPGRPLASGVDETYQWIEEQVKL